MEKEEFFQKRMLELSKKAFFRGILTFSDFLDLNQQNILHSLLPGLENTGVRVRMFGGYETAERQMAAFVLMLFVMRRILRQKVHILFLVFRLLLCRQSLRMSLPIETIWEAF